MRFHRLLIENITSLRGIHTIDFDTLGKIDDIFAITGPTGSGKSSILTAIMLALYGKTSKGLVQADVISLGEKKARIELVFSINNRKIHAYWETKSKGRRFIDEKGESLPLDMLPLSFDQFCKTIILNQGDFSKFLTSSFVERKDILEKLYGESFLSKLSPRLNTLIKEKSSTLVSLNDQEQLILPYKEEEVILWKEQIGELFKEIQSSKETREIFKIISKELKDLLFFYKKKTDLDNKKGMLSEELIKQTQLFNLDQEKVTLSQNALNEMDASISKKRPLWHALIQKENEKDHLTKRIAAQKNTLSAISSKMEMFQKQKESEHLRLEEKKKHLETLNHDLVDFPHQEILFFESLFNSLENHLKRKKELVFLIENETLHLNKLKELKSSKTKSLIEAQQELKTISISENYDKTKELLEKNRSLAQDQSKERESTKKKIIELQKEIVQAQEQLEKIQLNLESLSKQAPDKAKGSHLELIEKIKKHFKFLAQKEGSCPICEQKTKQVPIQAEDVDSLESISEKTLAIQEESLLRHKTFIKEEQSLRHLLTHSDLLKDEILKNTQLLEQLRPEEELKHFIQQTTKELQTLEEGHKKQLITEQNILHLKKDEERLAFEEIEKKNNLEKLNAELSSLEDKLKILYSDAIFLQKYKNEEERLLILKKLITSLKEKETLTHLIEEIKKNYSEKIQILDTLKTEQAKEQAEFISNEEKNRILNAELANELPNGLSASQLLKKAEEDLSLLRRKKEELSRELQKSSQLKHGIEIQIKSNSEQIEDIILHLTRLWIKLKELFLLHKGKLPRLPDKILATESAVEIESWDLLDIFLEKELTQKIESFDFSIEEKSQELEEKKAKINLFEQKKEQQKSIQELIQKEKAEMLRWNNLHDLIGNDEFRNFTLSLIESELITFSNKELETLCQGRFGLVQNEAKKGNDFSVIDRWKGGEMRKVSTLSGGETFLVSLAMAMALSEMSRGTASVESFFIDEGFGTLDQDSLSEVLEALSNLKGRGKVVGIISHVKELTERIAVNISVKKNSSGDSKIEILYN